MFSEEDHLQHSRIAPPYHTELLFLQYWGLREEEEAVFYSIQLSLHFSFRGLRKIKEFGFFSQSI